MKKRLIKIGLLAILKFSILQSAQAALYLEHPIQQNLLTDNKLHLILCGTGNPQVSMQNIRKPSCIAMLGAGHFFLFDTREGAIQKIAGMGLPYPSISKVFITNWHSDHFNGLGQVLNASWMRGRKNSIEIYGPKGINQVVAGLKQTYQLDVTFRSENRQDFLNPKLAFGIPHLVQANKKGVTVYHDKTLQINAFAVNHLSVKPALGYQLKYKNCNIVVSGNAKVVTSFAHHAKNADVLINEALSYPLYKKITPS